MLPNLWLSETVCVEYFAGFHPIKTCRSAKIGERENQKCVQNSANSPALRGWPPLLLLYFNRDGVPAAYRPETCRPRCWSGCSWSSQTPFPSRSSLLRRSALRSLNTTRVRGAMRERSNSTKKLLCIVRQIARSVQRNQKRPVCSLQLCVTSAGVFWGLELGLSQNFVI